MGSVALFRAWCIAAAVTACSAAGVHAEGETDDAPIRDSHAQLAAPATGDAGVLRGGSTPERFLYFGGFDLWRSGLSAHDGLLWAPAGLNHDGLILKLLVAEGSYLYRLGTRNVRGVYLLGSAMVGWRISRNGVELKAFAGPDLQYHRFTPADPGNALSGPHLGLRVGIESWWQIHRDAMLTGSLSASTIGLGYGARGAAGWRIIDAFYAGPEVETSGDRSYRQFRAGLHLTALRTGRFEWSAGFGYVIDNSRRSGVYGRLGILLRR